MLVSHQWRAVHTQARSLLHALNTEVCFVCQKYWNLFGIMIYWILASLSYGSLKRFNYGLSFQVTRGSNKMKYQVMVFFHQWWFNIKVQLCSKLPISIKYENWMFCNQNWSSKDFRLRFNLPEANINSIFDFFLLLFLFLYK